jgi:hypothetical protein
MMRLRRASVIVVLSLLASAATAYAECSWVLWVHYISPLEDFSIDEAYPAMKDCSQGLLDYGKTMMSKGHNVSGLFPGSRSATFQQDRYKGYLLCLPDTVDPRGPKGK